MDSMLCFVDTKYIDCFWFVIICHLGFIEVCYILKMSNMGYILSTWYHFLPESGPWDASRNETGPSRTSHPSQPFALWTNIVWWSGIWSKVQEILVDFHSGRSDKPQIAKHWGLVSSCCFLKFTRTSWASYSFDSSNKKPEITQAFKRDDVNIDCGRSYLLGRLWQQYGNLTTYLKTIVVVSMRDFGISHKDLKLI